MPEAVPIAHETIAVAMAHGFYLVTGRPQAVMVHVNVGTANALMGLINASRDNVPMLFTSGRTPLTERGLLGSRDLPIHWGQEMFDQGGMLRELVKWDYELREPAQLEAVVDRALAIAMSEPRGPAYLSLPREVLAKPWPDGAFAEEPLLKPASDPHPAPADIEAAADILRRAKRPLIIAGRGDAATFAALSHFAEQTAIPVVHFWPARMVLATTHPMHAGFDVMPRLAEADAVVVLDLMVPWLPSRHSLAEGCRVVQIGPDPSFSRVPMRSFPGDILIRSNVAAALAALGVVARRRTRQEEKSDRSRACRRAQAPPGTRVACAGRSRHQRLGQSLPRPAEGRGRHHLQ